MRALIADDSLLTRSIIRDHLEHVGIQVVAEAEDAQQALTLFRTVRPDLVALDAAARVAGGVDALSVFRSIRSEAPTVPVLVLSGFEVPQMRDTFVREGALDYVVKPLSRTSFTLAWRKLRSRSPGVLVQEAERHNFRGWLKGLSAV